MEDIEEENVEKMVESALQMHLNIICNDCNAHEQMGDSNGGIFFSCSFRTKFLHFICKCCLTP